MYFRGISGQENIYYVFIVISVLSWDEWTTKELKERATSLQHIITYKKLFTALCNTTPSNSARQKKERQLLGKHRKERT
jgi:hypothetical protein